MILATFALVTVPLLVPTTLSQDCIGNELFDINSAQAICEKSVRAATSLGQRPQACVNDATRRAIDFNPCDSFSKCCLHGLLRTRWDYSSNVDQCIHRRCSVDSKPEVSEVYPLYGPPTGGTRLTVIGKWLNFSPAKVTLHPNNNGLPFWSTDNANQQAAYSSLVAVTRPSNITGRSLQVVVDFIGGPTLHTGFYFVYQPVVHDMQPRRAMYCVYMQLTINGTKLGYLNSTYSRVLHVAVDVKRKETLSYTMVYVCAGLAAISVMAVIIVISRACVRQRRRRNNAPKTAKARMSFSHTFEPEKS